MPKVHFLKVLSLAIVVAVAAGGSNFAAAQDKAPLGVEWQCVQQHDEYFRILCVPKPTGDGSVAPEALGGIVKASLPLGRDMRPVAEHNLAQAFSAEAKSVPLFAQPKDTVMVGQLLQTVLCDDAPRCTVSYRSN